MPGIPRGKERPRIGKVAGRAIAFTPPKTRSEEGAVRMFAAAAMADRPPMEGPLEMRLLARTMIPASWPVKKQNSALAGDIKPTGRPDLSNITKLYEDGMNGIVWKDDAQVVSLSVQKIYSHTPNIEIYVAKI